MKVYCGSILAVTGTTKSRILGWKSSDEAQAFKVAYEKLGFDVRLEAGWTPGWRGTEE